MPRKLTRSEVRELLVEGRMHTYLEQLTEIERLLFQGYETKTDATTRMEVEIPLDGPRIQGLTKAADLIWRRIDKVVPSPKAIELTGAEGQALTMAEPDRLVLATKLLALVREKEQHDAEMPEWMQ